MSGEQVCDRSGRGRGCACGDPDRITQKGQLPSRAGRYGQNILSQYRLGHLITRAQRVAPM